MADEKPRWNFEKLGMTYRCWADDIQTEFRLSHVKRSRDSLSGILKVSTNLAGVKTVNGVLHAANFNVLSTSTRTSLANALEKRTPMFPNMDWFDGLEWLCQHVIISEEHGEDINEVGLDAPTPQHDRWCLEPLIMKGRPALLFGPGGVGKSLIALTCGLSVAYGLEIIPGMPPAQTGPILYLDWETTKDVINDRIQNIANGHDFKPVPKSVYYRRCVRPLANDAEELSALVADKGIVLVIVDSSAYAMGAQGEYGDANESILRMHEGLRIIGVTSLLVDHVNKTDAKAKGGAATPYGSAYKTNAARVSWEVRKEASAEGLRISLYHAKSNDTALLPPIGIALDWTYDSIKFRKTEVEAPVTEPVEDRTLLKLMIELTDDVSEIEISRLFPQLEALDHKLSTIRTTFYRAVDSGVFLKTERRGVFRRATRPVKLPSIPRATPGLFD
jgi:hypothetical protein